ncbi:MAG: 3-oxoacyl-ACP reductase [Tagaea sp. CACIAM 22H2]|nr:3-oxoacyl-ACP reductase [Tagaea sp. CACIAM 22H2]
MSAIYPDLENLPVLITGAASGIGASLTAHFARQKAKLGLIDINEAGLAQIAADAKREGASAVATLKIDLRDVAALRKGIADLAGTLGVFRVLINNAGDDARLAADKVEPDYWDDRMAVNLRHQFFAAQAVAPGMQQAGGGSIVNLGSISWMFGAPGLIAYTTAKSAVMGMTKSLAREFGPMGIRVNSIAPGMIWTEKQTARARADDPAKLARYLERQCIKEPLEPADVSRLALWLASAEARRASGQTYVIDGGVV